MRIKRIQIEEWRHFRNISLDIDPDSGLVCIVGANGSGKSHLLELISACAHHLGLTPGVDIPRGNPFKDNHHFNLQFHLTNDAVSLLESDPLFEETVANWDKTLTLVSQREEENITTQIFAGGAGEEIGTEIVRRLAKAKGVYFLSLDANRAYPKKQTRAQEIAEAYEIDWKNEQYTKGRSYLPSYTLYDEWIKYFLAQENQAGTKLIRDTRQAREDGSAEPQFNDHFHAYTNSLQTVLPHLIFSGVNSKARTLLFNTTGITLTFDQLSGGEREIAFLVGQIDRFALRHGLFLLDEPELHLNADLIRSWVTYLTSTVRTGQVWLATHSLEAVEIAGKEATYVLERNENNRLVDSAKRLDEQVVLSALSRAVGTPAFSISQRVFIYVEGDEGLVEKQRFRSITNCSDEVRFIEGGCCNEVIRRVNTIKQLATESDLHIRIGGIVDRDWQTNNASSNNSNVHVLGVHEIENFFLHPPTLQQVLNQIGKPSEIASSIILECTDKRLGSWLYQSVMAQLETSPSTRNPEFKKRMKQLCWPEGCTDLGVILDRIESETGDLDESFNEFRKLFGVYLKKYDKLRHSGTIWRYCEGKQVLSDVARECGFSKARHLESACAAVWSDKTVEIPPELLNLRNFVQAL